MSQRPASQRSPGQRLLVSVRGATEAVEAASAGAAIVDVEYPASALGTPYPLNILSVRSTLQERGHTFVQISTNIGEDQESRPSACQAALGVATAGADLIKFGLAGLSLEPAVYLARSLVRTVKHWYPEKATFPAVFVDTDLVRFLKPFQHGVDLVMQAEADGLLVDTHNKLLGQGLLDYCSLEQISKLVDDLHQEGKEAWIAGSITLDEMAGLWSTNVDVICVRGAACTPGQGNERFGQVDGELVRQLVATIPA